ncbi:MAG: Rpn family recombination-promoting nuclease/putative transposase [Bryobacterales bacterium]|nr:Rpn family recombination-promoting nuclease/putative transposase [Bryobacterales bacterium]
MPHAWWPGPDGQPRKEMGLGARKNCRRFDYNPQSMMTGSETADLGPPLFTAEMRVPRDAALKRFALNADFLRHLLRAHPLDDLAEAQIASIKTASANLIGPDLSQRLTDAAWQMELRDGSLGFLLLECQAEPDPTMPFRALHSVATLGLKLSRDPPEGYSATRVPPVLHLTLYTGRRAWSIAGVDVESEGESEPFWHWLSRVCRLLVLRRLPDPAGEENLAVLLARLQRCEDPEALRGAAAPLQAWAADAAHAELASAFAAWITHVVLPDLGIVDVPVSDNLTEVLEMLEQEPRTWADRMRDEGHRTRLVALLLRLARRRFGGGLAERLEGPLQEITDNDRLEDIGEWIVVCESGEALLAELRKA